ncbi:MFS transporter [Nocardiopsis trehalosi]|uniref:MFS transporter n=1 Tax=Nocardiopsis trehalosi TaxID=109329 RepID=UPI00082EBCF0|nr:MFS transporter [Nocardiopsis trehalosi]
MKSPPSPDVSPGHLPSPYHRAAAAECRDWSGRSYRIGASARDLTGRDRGVHLARAAAAAAAAGVPQFAYGAAIPALMAVRGWGLAAALLPLVVWALVQGGSAVPIARLRARGALPPSRALLIGAPLCAAAPLSLAAADGLAAVVVGYGVLGGLGAGLVYHSCVHLVAAWYPEHPVARAGLAGGAFALGAVPVAAGALLLPSPGALAPACAVLAAAILVCVAGAGLRLPEPPPMWWPPGTDPRAWALRGRADPLAGAEHSPAQAWRSGALPALHAVVALGGAAALFDLAVLPVFLLEGGHPPAAVAAVAAVLVAASGLGRIAAGRRAERTGRRRVLVAVLLAGAAAQFGLLAAGTAGWTAAVLLLAVPAGVGGGSCYPLTRALAMDYFGARHSPDIHGLVYSAKGVGGLLGVGGAAVLAVLAPASAPVIGLCAAGAAALGAAAVAARMRRPLPVRTIPL